MFTTRPELRGTFGVVASTHWIASTVGMSMAELGGNLPAAWRGAADRAALPQSHSGRDLSARRARGRGGGRRSRAADRGGAALLVQRLRRRGNRPVLPYRDHRQHRAAAPWA